MSDSLVESSRQPAVARRASKREQHPADLLGALVFLASPDSDFVTGRRSRSTAGR